LLIPQAAVDECGKWCEFIGQVIHKDMIAATKTGLDKLATSVPIAQAERECGV
jgi:hypothetical protein